MKSNVFWGNIERIWETLAGMDSAAWARCYRAPPLDENIAYLHTFPGMRPLAAIDLDVELSDTIVLGV